MYLTVIVDSQCTSRATRIPSIDQSFERNVSFLIPQCDIILMRKSSYNDLHILKAKFLLFFLYLLSSAGRKIYQKNRMDIDPSDV